MPPEKSQAPWRIDCLLRHAVARARALRVTISCQQGNSWHGLKLGEARDPRIPRTREQSCVPPIVPSSRPGAGKSSGGGGVVRHEGEGRCLSLDKAGIGSAKAEVAQAVRKPRAAEPGTTGPPPQQVLPSTFTHQENKLRASTTKTVVRASVSLAMR